LVDRRRFLTAAAAAFQADAVARAQSASAAASGRPADAVARDEDFWFNIRHVDRNIINPNNGGLSPYYVRRIGVLEQKLVQARQSL
jgi:hypothetical protein